LEWMLQESVFIDGAAGAAAAAAASETTVSC
jgi:hypothetical protein